MMRTASGLVESLAALALAPVEEGESEGVEQGVQLGPDFSCSQSCSQPCSLVQSSAAREPMAL